MIFYTKPFGLREEDAEYKFNQARFLIGVCLVGGLIGASFLARSIQWDDGAKTLLNFGQIALGGLVGLLFGERNALKQTRRLPRKE